MQEVTSKQMDGITDLVVVAPIKSGFIEAYDNITYATRLKFIAEALNKVRLTAREFERTTPYADVTERILSLLDFRIGILDKDLFGLSDKKQNEFELETQRYLYLTATFDGGWETYMRLIWRPLGAFLDLLFCNCEGYITATEHGCDEYLQWVRDNQVDSSIFYAVSGITVRDQRYLSRLERLERNGEDELGLAKLVMEHPDRAAASTRMNHVLKGIELAVEALTVLYKLADYYPPEWMFKNAGLGEGHRLIRATRQILLGWDQTMAELDKLPDSERLKQIWLAIQASYSEPLEWYRSGSAHVIGKGDTVPTRPDPDFDPNEIQGGILKPQGSREHPVRSGALLLFTIHDAAAARAFIDGIHFDFGVPQRAAEEAPPELYRNIAFSPHGLLRLGLPRDILDRFPKDFRDGMAERSGVLGDRRENHPRNWILPRRNGPRIQGRATGEEHLPPVDLGEVDFVIQLRSTGSSETIEDAIGELTAMLEGVAGAPTLEAVEFMTNRIDPHTGLMRDFMGFVDGVSQPRPDLPGPKSPQGVQRTNPRDKVRVGEVLLGYANDRGDPAPAPFADLDGPGSETRWRSALHKKALSHQLNGSFLVVRKIAQDSKRFDAWLDEKSPAIASQLGIQPCEARERLKAAMLGREPSGKPLINAGSADWNDFDYSSDAHGVKCPLSSHIRRANPRRTVLSRELNSPLNNEAEFNRPSPRIMRRGMLFGSEDQSEHGLMFMAYNASICEQYEVVQRWLNGGNSTDIASAQNDPLTGVLEKEDPKATSGPTFRFVSTDSKGMEQVIRVALPKVTPIAQNRESDTGRHPFTPLHWGMYLFAPSRSGLAALIALKGEYEVMRDPLENAVGQVWIDRLGVLSREEAGREWKRLTEDLDVKDPSKKDITGDVWANIRWKKGGVVNLRNPIGARKFPAQPSGPGTIPKGIFDQLDELRDSGLSWDDFQDILQDCCDDEEGDDKHDWENPDVSTQNVILCAGRSQVRYVLHDFKHFSNEEQLRRIHDTSGPIYVTQQPDVKTGGPVQYKVPKLNQLGLDYAKESVDTNAILMGLDEKWGFETGYAAGKRVLDALKAQPTSQARKSFKIELRRQFLFPALGWMYKDWYGLPDGKHMEIGGWDWESNRQTVKCPGDFLSPSRYAFYPRPSETVGKFARQHGTAIFEAGKKFVAEHRAAGGPPSGPIAQEMFKKIADDDVLARNIIGTMVGAIPPTEANLRGVIAGWLIDGTLWRHQAALLRTLDGKSPNADVDGSIKALRVPVEQAMCMRPAPDLLFRTAREDTVIPRGSLDRDTGCPRNADPSKPPEHLHVKEGDLVVVSQVSACHRSLMKGQRMDVSFVFGGKRNSPDQTGSTKLDYPVHACPAQKLALGGMMGILAALLEVGTIKALPASLIVEISDW